MPKSITVIGAGIVGLAVAREAQRRFPEATITVLEKEPAICRHQSGRNSGVIHTGVYYRPGSLKAFHCTNGRRLLVEFCEEHHIPHEICGKIIVATNEDEIQQLARLRERAEANGVRAAPISPEGIQAREPAVRGLAGLLVPDAGIVDYPAVCRALATLIEKAGGEVRTSFEVTAITRGASGFRISAEGQDLQTEIVINCAGLHSDRISRRLGAPPSVRIVPFKGEYYKLRADRTDLCRHLIYPVPNPAFPFLGVHFTRMIDGSVECGPNAVLALAREGYTKTSFNRSDIGDYLRFPGFWRLTLRHARRGAGEWWRSLWRPAFVRALQRLIPEVRSRDLVPAEPGIRAQAVARDGSLVDDFVIANGPGFVSVVNAPSPAATAALSLAKEIVTHLK